MILTVFQAGKGDCLLLRSRDGKHVLVDGGMRADYVRHVARALAQLHEEGNALDLVYVSHIDQDHISGVLQLMDDHVAWRVYRYQQQTGNERYPQPKQGEPPQINDLWHNAFKELVRENSERIEEALVAHAGVLEAAATPQSRLLARQERDLATSVAEGIELTRRASPDQLGIPLNRHFGGKLAFVRESPPSLTLGTLTLTVIGPFASDLRALRREWNEWLTTHQQQLARLRQRMQRDSDRFATDFDRLQAALAADTEELGRRGRVTVPNLASLMLLVKEDGRTLLLTGDGHHRDILRGLERADALEDDGSIHVDVLKIQHHGSEHNLDAAFTKRVTADHYLFLANGEHKNPDLRVVKTVIDSRLGPRSARSTHPRAADQFTFHFNSSPATTDGDERKHMQAVQELATRAAKASGGLMQANFLDESSLELHLD